MPAGGSDSCQRWACLPGEDAEVGQLAHVQAHAVPLRGGEAALQLQCGHIQPPLAIPHNAAGIPRLLLHQPGSGITSRCRSLLLTECEYSTSFYTSLAGSNDMRMTRGGYMRCGTLCAHVYACPALLQAAQGHITGHPTILAALPHYQNIARRNNCF